MNNQKILVVDDAIFMRLLLADAISKMGYKNIFYAIDGKEAIEVAKDLKPDLVTMDISMPNIDGIDAVKRVLEVSPKSKIVMVSAMWTQDVLMSAIKNGAVDFILKPFDMDNLKRVLCRYLDA